MSAEKKYTERDLVLAKREAFKFGMSREVARGETENEYAARVYPLQKVTRPRVVKDDTGAMGSYFWRICGGVLQHQPCSVTDRVPNEQEWSNTSPENSGGNYVYLARVGLLADLLARPTEEIES